MLIHIYDSKNSNPELATVARDYARISADECLWPMTSGLSTGKQLQQLIYSLLSLIESEDDPWCPSSEQSVSVDSRRSSESSISTSPMRVHQLVTGMLPPPTKPKWKHLLSTTGPPFSDLGIVNGFDWTGKLGRTKHTCITNTGILFVFVLCSMGPSLTLRPAICIPYLVTSLIL